MADNHTYGSIVISIVGLHVEERRLKDTGREADFIGRRVIVSVHRLRSHVPFVTVDRLVQLLVYDICQIELIAAHDVGPVTVVLDFQARIVAPFVGIAHLDIERCQFVQSHFLRLVAHPILYFDTFSQSVLQVFHQFHHTFFGCCGKVFLYIFLA